MEHVQQVVRIGLHRTDACGFEDRRESSLERVAVFEKVGGSRRAAAVVFEDVVLAIAGAHEVGAADVNVNVTRDIHATELRTVVCRVFHKIRGDHAFLDDLLIVVDVVEEGVEGGGGRGGEG